MTQPNAVVVETTHSPHARLRPVPVNAVTLADEFWKPRLEINRTVTLPSQHRHLEETGCLDNFRRAAGQKDVPFRGPVFADSDAYKWLEAACWALATNPEDNALRALVNETVAIIAAAQQSDGYLNTFFSLERAEQRWSNLRDNHEMYCAGHFIQAAVAHARATGETAALQIAARLADCLCDTFGPAEDGKRPGTCGHEEIEMALVELSRLTGEARYLQQAQYFLDARGATPSVLTKQGSDGDFDRRYFQDHVPFRELAEVTGHAVRMTYLACGATDVYAETGEAALKDALARQWANMTERRMYVTGGLGARHEGEAFGADYELPSDRAYAETCAAIAAVMWNWRLLQLTGEAKYADLMELALYNGVLSGLSLDGTEYFYVNPLADDGKHRRQPWFGCACCPPNVARLLASLPGYFYSTGPWRGELQAYIHIYASGTATLSSPEWRSHTLSLRQETDYPWSGEIKITVTEAPDIKARLFLHVPSWATGQVTIQVNDEEPRLYVREDGDGGEFTPHQYGQVCRLWSVGDTIRLLLPMPVRQIVSHPRVADTRGCIALMRGPLVYCVEQADHLDPNEPSDVDIRDIVTWSTNGYTSGHNPDLLGGVTTLHFVGMGPTITCPRPLYQNAQTSADIDHALFSITAIPYYVWANRAPGPMRVWLPLLPTGTTDVES